MNKLSNVIIGNNYFSVLNIVLTSSLSYDFLKKYNCFIFIQMIIFLYYNNYK
jgi:hypothetical protein